MQSPLTCVGAGARKRAGRAHAGATAEWLAMDMYVFQPTATTLDASTCPQRCRA